MNQEAIDRAAHNARKIAELRERYTDTTGYWVPTIPPLFLMFRDFHEPIDGKPPVDLMKNAHRAQYEEDLKRFKAAKPKIIKMRKKGWTHEKIGNKLGYHKSTISKYLKKIEKGE